MRHLTVFARLYCHLCDELLDALKIALGDAKVVVHVVDIDNASPEIEARWDEWVPVLISGTPDEAGLFTGQPLSYYRLNLKRLNEWIK
jgi:Glutaredoxin-like domain (DUF836)